MKFKTLQMIIDGHNSLYEDIKSIVQYGSNKYYYNKEVYLINKIIIKYKPLSVHLHKENAFNSGLFFLIIFFFTSYFTFGMINQLFDVFSMCQNNY